MTRQTNSYCVILAGGRGRRLWPCSRNQYPKQFIDFFGVGRTQLQQTYDRFAQILPKDHIVVSTNIAYADYVRQQLPELPEDHLLCEPIHRNTAPSVAWAAHHVMLWNPDANIVVAPSDQTVFNEQAFAKNVQEGLDFVSAHESVLVLGVKPTRPEPGYGYIQLGDEEDTKDVYRVKSFTEKPERQFAQMFMESGEFYWNTGVFISSAQYMLTSLRRLFREISDRNDLAFAGGAVGDEADYVKRNFAAYPNVAIDFAVLEKTEKVCVMAGDFGWADLGTWHSIYEAFNKGGNDNVAVNSTVVFENCSNNVVKVPKERLAVINGLDGYIVAEHDNVLLICKKEDSSVLIRKYVNELQIKEKSEYI